MMILALLLPLAILGVLLGMERVERWVVEDSPGATDRPRRPGGPQPLHPARTTQWRGSFTTLTKKSSIRRTTSMKRSKSTGLVT